MPELKWHFPYFFKLQFLTLSKEMDLGESKHHIEFSVAHIFVKLVMKV